MVSASSAPSSRRPAAGAPSATPSTTSPPRSPKSALGPPPEPPSSKGLLVGGGGAPLPRRPSRSWDVVLGASAVSGAFVEGVPHLPRHSYFRTAQGRQL